MTKAELVTEICDKTGIAKKDIAEMLNAFESAVIETVAKGESILIPGFLRFERKEQKGRSGKIPGTDKTYRTEDTFVPKITAGKVFKRAVAGK